MKAIQVKMRDDPDWAIRFNSFNTSMNERFAMLNKLVDFQRVLDEVHPAW